MNLLERLKHIWELSAYEPAHPGDGKKYPEYPIGTEVSMIIKKPGKKVTKVFLPRVTITPAEEIVNEQST